MTALTTKNFHDKLLTAISRLKTDAASKSYNENKWHRRFWNDLINFINQNDEAMISLVSNSNMLEIITLPMDSSYDEDIVSTRLTLFQLLLTRNIIFPLQNGVQSLSTLITLCNSLNISEDNQQIINIAFKYFISFNIDNNNNTYNKFRAPSIFTYIYRHTVDNKVHEATHYFGDYGRNSVDEWKILPLLYQNNFILHLIQRGFEIFSVYKLIKHDDNLIRKCPFYYSSDDKCYYNADKIEQYINNGEMELNNDFDNFMKSSNLWGNRLCFQLFITKLHFVPLALRELKSILYGYGSLNDTVIDIILEYHMDIMNNVNEYDDIFIELSINQFLLGYGFVKRVNGRSVDRCGAIDLMFFIDNILIPIRQREPKYYEKIVDTIRKLGNFDLFSIEFDFDWDKRYWFYWLELSKHGNNVNGKKWKVNVLKIIIEKFIDFGDVYYLNLLFETISKRRRFTRVYKHASAILGYSEYWEWMTNNLLDSVLKNQDIDQQCKDVIIKYQI
eukprot:284581_1